MRILALTNLPSPYRVEFFNELGQNTELTVMFERHSAHDRDQNWKTTSKLNYNEIYIAGKPIGNESSISLDTIQHLKKRDYDVLFIMGYASPTSIIAIAYCRLHKIPYIINSDGAVEKNEDVFKKALKKYLISGALAWLCSGESASAYLQKYGAKEDRIYVYPFTSLREKDILGSLPSKLKKEDLRHNLGIREHNVILAVGRFIPLKRYDVLIEAFAHIDNDARLIIIGGGEERDTYEKLITSKEIKNVTLIDFKTKDELSPYYDMADLFVHPTNSDVWGLVINEAMAHGLPVITTDKCVAGVELIENNENGYIVPAGNTLQLADRIYELLSAGEKLKKMSEANLRKISGYTIEKMAKRHVEIFKKLMYI